MRARRIAQGAGPNPEQARGTTNYVCHTRASGGKEYWAEGLRVLGVIEQDGIVEVQAATVCDGSPQYSYILYKKGSLLAESRNVHSYRN
jgi:hypothetical protein